MKHLFTICMMITTIGSFLALMYFLYTEQIEMDSFFDNLTYFLLAGIFLPICTLITLRLTKSNENSNEPTALEIKSKDNSQSKYCEHLQEYFGLLEKLESDETTTYFEKIVSLEEDKKEILKQHIFTYDKHPQTKVSLFQYYKWITEARKSLPINRNVLLDEIRTISSTLSNATRTYKDFTFHAKTFENSLHLPKDLTDMVIEGKYTLNFEDKLDFSIQISGIYDTWSNPHIKNTHLTIAESESKETIDDVHDEIFPNIIKANKCLDQIWTANQRIEYMNKNMDKIIQEILTMIQKGAPTVGVCNICKDFTFVGKNENMIKKLNKYNSKEKIREEFWWQNDNYFKYEDDH